MPIKTFDVNIQQNTLELSVPSGASAVLFAKAQTEATLVLAIESQAQTKISEDNSKESENAAAFSASAVSILRDESRRWATEDEDVVVEGGEFSSRHYSIKTKADAVIVNQDKIATAVSESNAGISASAALLSEQNSAANKDASELSSQQSETSNQESAAEASAALTHQIKAALWAEAPEGTDIDGTSSKSSKYWAMYSEARAAGAMKYKNGHDASTGAPDANPNEVGDFYKISVGGDFGGHTYVVNDSAVYNNLGGWDKIDSTDQVTSVAGRVGNITLTDADITNWASAVHSVGDPRYLRADTNSVALGNITFNNGINVAGEFNAGTIALSGNLTRSAHNTGHLEGGFSNVGHSGGKTNPIYTVGSLFNPEENTLGPMLGIGFTNTDAPFIDFVGASGGNWGMYVASSGVARVWLDSDNGNISSKGSGYFEGNINAKGAVFDNGVSTNIDVISDDTGKSEIRLYGNGSGTGRLFVGQDTLTGGGLEYNGDNSPSSAGGGADYLTLYRVNNTVEHWTARNYAGDNIWEFRDNVKVGGNLTRTAHHKGHLEGGSTNIGDNAETTNPIFTIGAGYGPEESSLNNMYGIGYCNALASFIDFTGATGWGMYVASNGFAKIWLDGSNGNVSTKGSGYFEGTVQHTGLVPTAGGNIDQVVTRAVDMSISPTWADTGISGADLTSGVYMIELQVSDNGVGGGHYDAKYSGTFSWFSATTNSTGAEEMVLHATGHALPDDTDRIKLRTKRNTSPGFLNLQISAGYTTSGSSVYTFKFRRIM
jgi:hypothetical protein